MERTGKRYIAVRIKGDIFVMNDQDELGGLIDRDVEYEMLGEVCDDEEFGDNCTTDCVFYRRGTCRTEVKRDVFGNLIHVKRY